MKIMIHMLVIGSRGGGGVGGGDQSVVADYIFISTNNYLK